jgi:hypothetical protein
MPARSAAMRRWVGGCGWCSSVQLCMCVCGALRGMYTCVHLCCPPPPLETHTQGLNIIRAKSQEQGWGVNLGGLARIWKVRVYMCGCGVVSQSQVCKVRVCGD